MPRSAPSATDASSPASRSLRRGDGSLDALETGQLAHLAAIPFAHVDQMAIHLAAPLGDEAFLLLQLLGLLGQPRRHVGDLLRLLVDLAGPAFQPRLVQVQRLLELGEPALPLDDLLAKGGDRQAMLVARHVQIQFLLPHALDLGLKIAAHQLQVVAALADVAVDLSQMFAQLLARLRQDDPATTTPSPPAPATVGSVRGLLAGSPPARPRRRWASSCAFCRSTSKAMRSEAITCRCPPSEALHFLDALLFGLELLFRSRRASRLLVQLRRSRAQFLPRHVHARLGELPILLDDLRLLAQTRRLRLRYAALLPPAMRCFSFSSSTRRRTCSCRRPAPVRPAPAPSRVRAASAARS